MSRTPKPDLISARSSVVHPYGRPAKKRPSTHLMVCLHQDALEAVMAAMAAHGLTRSGAIHHLVRLGAGLKPLIP